MASLLLPDDDPATPPPLLQLPDERPPSLQPDPRADALGQTYKDITDYMARKQQESVDQGYWAGGGLLEGGHPTLKAFNSAADEYAQGLLMGTTSSGGKYFKAYHGSPHKFDQFSDHAIGTGEGAQAYGYGHYLAESEDIARGYRDRLSKGDVGAGKVLRADGEPLPLDSLSGDQRNAALELMDSKGDFEVARHMVNTNYYPESVPKVLRGLDELEARKVTIADPGHMYEVQVNADPEKFLHWDKPLSEQHPDVRKALNDIGVAPPNASYTVRPVEGGHVVDYVDGNNQFSTSRVYKSAEDADRQASITMKMMNRDPTGAELVRQNQGIGAKLKEAGVPGIRYLDAQSRVSGPRQVAQSKQAIADRQSQIAEIQADITRNQNNPNLLPRYFAARQEEIAQHQQVIDQINERMSEGTHNAVVFDPATMEIIRRYGLAGLMLGGGGLLSPDKQEQ